MRHLVPLLLSACATIHGEAPYRDHVLGMPPDFTPDLTVVGHVHVDAAPAAVHAVLADLDRWPTWAPTIRAAATDAGRPVEPGDTFGFSPGGRTIRAEVLASTPGALLRWHGRLAPRLDGVWTFRLAPDGDGTEVVLEEAFHGGVFRAFGWAGTFGARHGVDATLEGLRARCATR